MRYRQFPYLARTLLPQVTASHGIPATVAQIDAGQVMGSMLLPRWLVNLPTQTREQQDKLVHDHLWLFLANALLSDSHPFDGDLGVLMKRAEVSIIAAYQSEDPEAAAQLALKELAHGFLAWYRLRRGEILKFYAMMVQGMSR